MGAVSPQRSALLTVQPRDRRRKVLNKVMEVIASVAALLAVAVLLLVIGSVVVKGIGAISFAFITQNPAPFGQPGGGIADSIVGTAELVGIASLIAIPIGILIGIFTAEFAPPWLGNSVRFALDILNGVPTIVTGVFIFGLLVVGSQQSGWAGSVALAIVMLPIVARSAQEVLALVPRSLHEAALALGLKRWRVVLRIVIPTAAGGLVTGEIGRASCRERV